MRPWWTRYITLFDTLFHTLFYILKRHHIDPSSHHLHATFILITRDKNSCTMELIFYSCFIPIILIISGIKGSKDLSLAETRRTRASRGEFGATGGEAPPPSVPKVSVLAPSILKVGSPRNCCVCVCVCVGGFVCVCVCVCVCVPVCVSE